MLGYLKKFPSYYVAGWAAGTGLAGPFPSLLYLLHRRIDTPYFLIYLLMLPSLAAYWALFLVLEKWPAAGLQEIAPLAGSVFSEEEAVVPQNLLLTFKNLRLVLPKIWGLVGNLGLVFFLEYIIITCFADRASKDHNETDPFYIRNAYAILLLCYQFGVFISRSSMSLFYVRRTYLLTTMQAVLFLGWAVIPFEGLNEFLQFGLMLLVGLAGGCSYVNTYHLILEGEQLPLPEKELGTNCCTLGNNLGTLGAEVATLVLSNTVYKIGK